MRDLVIHAPTGLLLDFGQENFGGVQEQLVITDWLRRAEQRGGRRLTDPGEFICHAHRDHENPWLTLARYDRIIVARHWPGTNLSGTHEIHHGVSDEHKRQVEYIQRAGQAAGFDVMTEVSWPTKVRSDAVIYGPTTTGIEVQHSSISVAAVKARTTKARKAGVLPIWFSDSADKDPLWLGQVPGVRMNEQAWDTVPRARSVTVVSGVRTVEVRRCRDLLRNTCPNRPRCNQWHAELDPRRGTTVDDLAELIPAGKLVPINFKTLNGKHQIHLVSHIDKQRYESVARTSADLPALPKQRLVRAGERSECAADAGVVVVREPMPAAPVHAKRQPGRCEAGVTPCGAVAQLYACGWRCHDHRPGAR